MIATEYHRDDPALGKCANALANVAVRQLSLTVRTISVAEIDNLQPIEDLKSEVQVVGAGLISRRTDRARAETCPWPISGPDVEGCANDRRIRFPRIKLFDLRQKRSVTERRQAGVGQIKLFGHPRRKLALMVVIVPHEKTVPGIESPGGSTSASRRLT